MLDLWRKGRMQAIFRTNWERRHPPCHHPQMEEDQSPSPAKAKTGKTQAKIETCSTETLKTEPPHHVHHPTNTQGSGRCCPGCSGTPVSSSAFEILRSEPENPSLKSPQDDRGAGRRNRVSFNSIAAEWLDPPQLSCYDMADWKPITFSKEGIFGFLILV